MARSARHASSVRCLVPILVPILVPFQIDLCRCRPWSLLGGYPDKLAVAVAVAVAVAALARLQAVPRLLPGRVLPVCHQRPVHDLDGCGPWAWSQRTQY